MTFINGDRQRCSYLYEISFISGDQFTFSRASFAVRQEIEKGLRAVDSNAQQPSAVNIIISAITTTIVVVNIINILMTNSSSKSPVSQHHHQASFSSPSIRVQFCRSTWDQESKSYQALYRSTHWQVLRRDVTASRVSEGYFHLLFWTMAPTSSSSPPTTP